MKTIVAAVLMFGCCAAASAAQLYRWVDAQGRVEWRDTPPPADAKQVEERKVPGNLPRDTTLSYAAQQAARNFPVTLWNAAGCGPACDNAKAHLKRRGVPYTERDGRADLDALRKATGGVDVPVLVVGRTQVKGYSESDWDGALDTAGYPSGAR